MSDLTAHTWADGFGVWHARIGLPGNGYTPQQLEANKERIRSKARRAIRREIGIRQAPQSFTVHLQVAGSDLGANNLTRSITYKEA